MYLMQSHNDKQYGKFIGIVFCCCKSFIRDKLMIESIERKLSMQDMNEEPGDDEMKLQETQSIDTTYTTNDISQNHGRIDNIELSTKSQI